MAKNLKYSVAAKTAKLGTVGLAAFIGPSAKLRIYSGTQPATADTAVTGTLLVEFICNATQFGTATSGVLTASAISNGTGTAGAAGGTAGGYYRIVKADGTTNCIDGTVGITGGTFDLELDNPSIATGQVVAVSSHTITEGN